MTAPTIFQNQYDVPPVMIEVRLAPSLRLYCGSMSEIRLQALNLADVMQQLESEHAPLFRSVCDETRTIRQHVNLFVNSELVAFRKLDQMDQTLRTGDIVTIWTAVSGG